MNPDAYLEMADTEARHWWFSGRRKILKHIIGTLGLSVNAKILEIGAGTGGNLQMLSSFGQVSAMEMDATARSIAVKRTEGKITMRPGVFPKDIPFEGEKFDLICLFDVLEHIDQDVETLRSMRHLLAEGGRVLVTVPAYQWLWGVHDDFLHHRRRYSAAELRRKVIISGFQPKKISYFNTILFPLVVLVRVKDKLLSKSTASGSRVPVAPVNQVCLSVFSSERFLLDKINLPFGISLLGMLQADNVSHANS